MAPHNMRFVVLGESVIAIYVRCVAPCYVRCLENVSPADKNFMRCQSTEAAPLARSTQFNQILPLRETGSRQYALCKQFPCPLPNSFMIEGIMNWHTTPQNITFIKFMPKIWKIRSTKLH